MQKVSYEQNNGVVLGERVCVLVRLGVRVFSEMASILRQSNEKRELVSVWERQSGRKCAREIVFVWVRVFVF